MLGSSLPIVVCGRADVLFVFVCVFSVSDTCCVVYFRCLTHAVLCIFGVRHMLCCVFVLLFFVFCAVCCKFLWIVHFVLPLRCSLVFTYTLLIIYTF